MGLSVAVRGNGRMKTRYVFKLIFKTRISPVITQEYNIFPLKDFRFRYYICSFVPNFVGLLACIVYFNYLDLFNIAGMTGDGNVTTLCAVLAGVLVVNLVTIGMGTRRTIVLFSFLKKYISTKHAEDDLIELKRVFLNIPHSMFASVVVSWFSAALLVPIMTSVFFSPPFVLVSYHFIGILFIGGSVSVVFTFLFMDSFMRMYTSFLFPAGGFNEIDGIRKIPFSLKFILSALICGIVPILLYYLFSRVIITTYQEYNFLSEILHSVQALAAFIFIFSVGLVFMSSLYFTKNFEGSLLKIENAMALLAKGDLTVALPIQQNDELGSVFDGFNRMVEGVRRFSTKHLTENTNEMEWAIACNVQNKVLTPKEYFKGISSLEIEVAYVPMNSRVGSDYYSIDHADGGKVSVMIAETGGKGIQAALATMELDILNRQSKERITPDKRLASISAYCHDNNPSNSGFSAFLCTINNSRVYFSSEGHPAQVLIKQKTGKIIPLKSKKRTGSWSKTAPFDLKSHAFVKGDVLILFTNGLCDEFNTSGSEFGEEGLRLVIGEMVSNYGLDNLSMQNINDYLLGSVREFVGSDTLNDDVTIISIRNNGMRHH